MKYKTTTPLFDTPISDKPHTSGTGLQKLYRFKNNYGASVVRFTSPIGGGYGSYTDNENEWELAVIKFSKKNKGSFELKYDTGITDDVIGHLKKKEVEKILEQIKKQK